MCASVKQLTILVLISAQVVTSLTIVAAAEFAAQQFPEEQPAAEQAHEAALIELSPSQKIVLNRNLCVAVKKKDKKRSESLLHQKASIHTQSNRGYQPIHIATMNNDVAILSLLLDHNATIEAIGNKFYTPLHIAAMKGHKNSIAFLLHRNADINALANNNTPIHFAASAGFPDALIPLLQQERHQLTLHVMNHTEEIHTIQNITLELPHIPLDVTKIIIGYKGLEQDNFCSKQVNNKQETALSLAQKNLTTEYDPEKQVRLEKCITLLTAHDNAMLTIITNYALKP